MLRGMDRTTLSPLLCSFELHLRGRQPLRRHRRELPEEGPPGQAYLIAPGRTLMDARRSDLEAFVADLLARRAPATAASCQKALRVLYRWLEEEGEITASPMAKVRPPSCRVGQ